MKPLFKFLNSKASLKTLLERFIKGAQYFSAF